MSKQIVIIDDSQLVLKMSRLALEQVGYTVQTLTDPGDFDPDRTGVPDLVLVDINMPQFYGDDIVSYIKDTFNLPTPILLFSNVSEDELQQAVGRCGADGYISKHWGMDAMVAGVRQLLGDDEEFGSEFAPPRSAR
jgi:DNA-binding NarL/FixJ family response regulator